MVKEIKQKGLLHSQKQINNISRLSVKKVVASQQRASNSSTKKLIIDKNLDQSNHSNVMRDPTQASEDVSE